LFAALAAPGFKLAMTLPTPSPTPIFIIAKICAGIRVPVRAMRFHALRIVSTIVHLLHRRYPTYIAGLVIAVRIASVDLHAGGLQTHIAQKINEATRALPTFAHVDPAMPVIFGIPLISW